MELNVAKKIIELRKSVGWSQSELSRQSGVTSAAISMIEKGNRAPTLGVLAKLSNAFNVSLAELCVHIPKNYFKEDEDTLFCREFSILKKLNKSDREIVKMLANRLHEHNLGMK